MSRLNSVWTNSRLSSSSSGPKPVTCSSAALNIRLYSAKNLLVTGSTSKADSSAVRMLRDFSYSQ